MTIPPRLRLPAVLLAVLAVRGDAAPAARPHVATPGPTATVAGSVPGSSLTLLELRRTGLEVVTARLRIAFEGDAGGSRSRPGRAPAGV